LRAAHNNFCGVFQFLSVEMVSHEYCYGFIACVTVL
jgi:hypothetical protein